MIEHITSSGGFDIAVVNQTVVARLLTDDAQPLLDNGFVTRVLVTGRRRSGEVRHLATIAVLRLDRRLDTED